MAAAVILKNRHISAAVSAISTKFGRMTQFGPRDRLVLYLKFKKFNMVAADIIKKLKLQYFVNGLIDRHSIWHDYAYWPSELDQQLKFRTFKNPRWRRAAILKNRINVVLMDIINSLLKTGNKTAIINEKTVVYTHC